MASGYMFSHYWPGDGLVNEVPVTSTQTYQHPWRFDFGWYGALILVLSQMS